MEKRNVRLIDKSCSVPREISQRGCRQQERLRPGDRAMISNEHQELCSALSAVLCVAKTSPEYFCCYQLICSAKGRSGRCFSTSLQAQQLPGNAALGVTGAMAKKHLDVVSEQCSLQLQLFQIKINYYRKIIHSRI